MSPYLFLFPVVFYLTGWLGEFLRYWAAPGERHPWPKSLLGIGWGAHGILLVSLLVQEGSSLSALLTGIAWGAIGIYYAAMWRLNSAVFPLVFPPLSIALLITAFLGSEQALLGDGGAGLSVAMTRNVLMAHIFSVLTGFLLFGLACLAGIVYLVQERRLKIKSAGSVASRLPSLGTLEGYNHKAILLGFFFLTVGLLLGLSVAGVDTLTARLLTLRQLIPAFNWLLYAVFLYFYDLQGRRGRFGAFWSIAGFNIVVFSFVFELLSLGAKSGPLP